MENADTILWAVFGVATLLFWCVGTLFMSQPGYNVLEIFRDSLCGKLLVFAPQLGFLVVIIWTSCYL